MEDPRVSQAPAEIAAAESRAEEAPPGMPSEPPVLVAAPPERTLKRSTVRATAWATVGYCVSFAMRFVSSVILTRLIAPDLLALAILPMSVLDGLNMLSDLGISQSVIQNRRGEEPSFLSTAWTLQAVRGVVLAI